MLLKIFKTSQPVSWILIVFLIVVVRLSLFIASPIEENATISPSILSNSLQQFNSAAPWFSHFISTILVIFSGFYFNKISQSHNLVKGIHYLLIFVLAIFLSFSPENLLCTPVIVTTPLLLFSYDILLEQAKGPLSLSEIFNSLFFIGLSQLIFPAAFAMGIAALVGVFYLNQPNWRQIVILIIGFVTPILFYDVLIFTFGTSEMFFTALQNSEATIAVPVHFKWSILGILVLTGLHLFTYFKTSSRSIMKIRKTLQFNLLFLFIGFGISLLSYIGFQDIVANVAIPLSIVFTVFYLETERSWVSNIAFVGLLAFFTLSHLGL